MLGTNSVAGREVDVLPCCPDTMTLFTFATTPNFRMGFTWAAVSDFCITVAVRTKHISEGIGLRV